MFCILNNHWIHFMSHGKAFSSLLLVPHARLPFLARAPRNAPSTARLLGNPAASAGGRLPASFARLPSFAAVRLFLPPGHLASPPAGMPARHVNARPLGVRLGMSNPCGTNHAASQTSAARRAFQHRLGFPCAVAQNRTFLPEDAPASRWVPPLTFMLRSFAAVPRRLTGVPAVKASNGRP